ncbi:unnamed protein product [Gordionus sp. m RMFG-2023]|uniref:annexin A5-like isoform X2 n=1 Tax=Gordionus sp. m RMFG-2023 TaxID=3053472 RepID=UPI0030E36D86
MIGPTIIDDPRFDARFDAEALKKAMQGIGTDEKTILRVLTKRSNRQRQLISQKYKELFNKVLANELQRELGGKFEKVILALMTPAYEYDAHKLHQAMKGLGTNEDVLIEILVSRSQEQLRKIMETYRNMYKKDLVSDIKGDTSGSFEKLMVYLCKANRKSDYGSYDKGKVNADAQALINAGIKNAMGTDTSVFCEILVNRSLSHVRAVFEEYQHISKHCIEDDIKREMKGDSENAFISLVECIRYPASYFAKKIHLAMKGMGTDDDTLVRLLVTRAEIDLGDIRQDFQRIYNKSLEASIKDECSGDYEDALVSLVVGNR